MGIIHATPTTVSSLIMTPKALFLLTARSGNLGYLGFVALAKVNNCDMVQEDDLSLVSHLNGASCVCLIWNVLVILSFTVWFPWAYG